MRTMHLSGIDLNLLPALAALLRHRNVTHAAEEVGLSQPAMSRALARLRDLLGDTLLVRIHGGYALTPRAEVIAQRLGLALDQVRTVFEKPEFDPARVERTFRIVCSDVQTLLLAPRLMARLADEAPGVTIRMEGYGPDLIDRMMGGHIDLAFAVSSTELPSGARSEPIARDRLAVVMRKGHPMARKPWTIGDYARFNHVGISIMGDDRSELDAQLAAAGVNRTMALVTPHFLAALTAVAQTNLVTTLSRALATNFASQYDLIMKEPPLPEIDLELTLVWTRLRDTDPVLAWLRSQIREVAAETLDLAGVEKRLRRAQARRAN